MKIKSLNFKDLRNEEHYKFYLDVDYIIQRYKVRNLGIDKLHPAFLTALQDEFTTLNIIRGSVITDELYETDLLRDKTFSGLAGTVKSALKHFDPEVSNAAIRLNDLLDLYGNLSVKPYDQETAAIIKLLSEFEGSYSTEVAKIGLTAWVQELKKQNNAFESLKTSRYDENALKPQLQIKNCRIETDKAYRAIVKRISAHIEINGDAAFAGFVNDLNLRIESYNQTLALRQGRNTKKEAALSDKQPEVNTH